jgi:hypothetical protein
MPFHVCIGLQNPAEPAGLDRMLEELGRFIEPVLADNTERDPVRGIEHVSRRFQIRGNRLFDQDGLSELGAEQDRLQAKVGQRADVDEIDVRVSADCLPSFAARATILSRELLAMRRIAGGARREFIADIAIGLGVLVSDGPGANDADAVGHAV